MATVKAGEIWVFGYLPFFHLCHKSFSRVSLKFDVKARCGGPSLADSGKSIHDPNPLSPGQFLLEAVSGSWWRVGGGGADLVAAWCRLAAGLVADWCRFGDVVAAWRRSGTYATIPFGSELAPLWHLRQTPVWCRAQQLLLNNDYGGYKQLVYVARHRR